MNRSDLPATTAPLRLRLVTATDHEFCRQVLPKSLSATGADISEANNTFILMLGTDLIGVVEAEGPKADSGLKSFYLAEEYQGRGIGHRLLEVFAAPLGKNHQVKTDPSPVDDDAFTSGRSRSSWSHIADLSYNEVCRSISRRILFCSDTHLPSMALPS